MPKPTTTTQQSNDKNVNGDNEPTTCTPETFSIERMSFKAMCPKKDTTQLVCFPKYLPPQRTVTSDNINKYSKPVVIVTKPIKITKGGIPRHDTKYHGPDINTMKRAYFYIGKNEHDPNSMELFKCIQAIDDYMIDMINTRANESGILSVLNTKDKQVKLKGITYMPMITKTKPHTDIELDDDDDDTSKNTKKDKKPFVMWERIKVKLSTEWDENLGPDDKQNINTQLYMGDSETPENCKTVTDFEEFFTWNCTAQFALNLNKVWIKKTDDKACSIGIKCIQIGITEQSDYKKNTSIGKQPNKRLFASFGPLKTNSVTSTPQVTQHKVNNDDNDDDDSDNEKVNVKVNVKGNVKGNENKGNEDSDNDDDASDNDDSDNDNKKEEDNNTSEPESDDELPAPTKKTNDQTKANTKTPTKSNGPATKQVNKVVVKKEDTDDTSGSEDDKPVQKKKELAPTTVKGKPTINDSSGKKSILKKPTR